MDVRVLSQTNKKGGAVQARDRIVMEIAPLDVVVRTHANAYRCHTPYLVGLVVGGFHLFLTCRNGPVARGDDAVYAFPWPHVSGYGYTCNFKPVTPYELVADEYALALFRINCYLTSRYKYFLNYGFPQELTKGSRSFQHSVDHMFRAWEKLDPATIEGMHYHRLDGMYHPPGATQAISIQEWEHLAMRQM